MRDAITLRAALTGGWIAAALALPAPLRSDTPDIALGLPSVAASSADTAAAIALGRKLFFDERLSASGKVSCATCHAPSRAMSDGRRVSVGDRGQRGTRNAPSLVNARFNDSFFWDGRRTTLEEQALDPLLNPVEHGLADAADLIGRLRNDPAYVRAFADAFGVPRSKIGAVHVARAIASFERTMIAGDSPFDRYYYKGERDALSAAAARGLEVFKGRGLCVKCHDIDEKHALFTDQKFHRLSVGAAAIAERLPELTRAIVEARSRGASVDRLVLRDPAFSELGRFVVTLDPQDIGRFRTPTLRNVALTAPYMHDGSVKTLEEAVELEVYYRGTDLGRPLILTVEERSDLVEFMRALTSPHAGRWKP